MLNISELLLKNHDLASFEDLVAAVKQGARQERFMRMDIKPPFPDTPPNWESVLEAAFNGPLD